MVDELEGGYNSTLDRQNDSQTELLTLSSLFCLFRFGPRIDILSITVIFTSMANQESLMCMFVVNTLYSFSDSKSSVTYEVVVKVT